MKKDSTTFAAKIKNEDEKKDNAMPVLTVSNTY